MSRKRPICGATVAAAALFLSAGLAAAQDGTVLDQAKAAYAARADEAQARSAVTLFAEAAKADPSAYEARWLGAAAAYYYGTYPREDAPDKEKMAIFQGGIDLAKEAVTLQPQSVEAHFWLGVLYGVYGEAKGIMKSLSLVPEIKQEMQLTLAADQPFEGWGADRVLGRMYFKLPFFKGGDNKKSIAHLERSLAGAPTNALTRVYLAATYKSAGMKDKAREQCRFVLDMQPDPLWAPEHPWIKRQAEALLKKL